MALFRPSETAECFRLTIRSRQIRPDHFHGHTKPRAAPFAGKPAPIIAIQPRKPHNIALIEWIDLLRTGRCASVPSGGHDNGHHGAPRVASAPAPPAALHPYGRAGTPTPGRKPRCVCNHPGACRSLWLHLQLSLGPLCSRALSPLQPSL